MCCLSATGLQSAQLRTGGPRTKTSARRRAVGSYDVSGQSGRESLIPSVVFPFDAYSFNVKKKIGDSSTRLLEKIDSAANHFLGVEMGVRSREF